MLYIANKKDFKILKKHLLKFYKNRNFNIKKSNILINFYEIYIKEEIDLSIESIFESVILLKKLIESKNKYIFSSYEKLKKSHDEYVNNLNNRLDRRFNFLKDGKGEYFFPPFDVDGYIYVNKYGKWKERISGKKVSLGAIIFHELYECYFIVDKNVEYLDGAHDLAVNKENILLSRLKKFNYDSEKFTKGSVSVRLVKNKSYFA